MADLMDHSNSSTQWNICFLRVAQDWELGFIAEFLSLLLCCEYWYCCRGWDDLDSGWELEIHNTIFLEGSFGST